MEREMEDQEVNPGVQILKRLECVMERSASSHGDDVSMQERVKEQYTLMMELGAVLKRSEDRSRVMEQRNKNLLNENQELYAKNAKNKDRLAQHHKKVRSLQDAAQKHAAVQQQYAQLQQTQADAAARHTALAEEHAITEKEYGILIQEHELVKQQKQELIEKMEVKATQTEELIRKLEVAAKEKEELVKRVADNGSVVVAKETRGVSTSTDDLVCHADAMTETFVAAVQQIDDDSVILTRREMDHLEEGMQALKACIKEREKTWSKLEKKERNQRGRITRLESDVLSLREMGHLIRQELEKKSFELKEKKAAAKQDQKEIASLKRQIVKERLRERPERSPRHSYDDTVSPRYALVSPRETPVSSREGPMTPRDIPVSSREGPMTPRKVSASRDIPVPSREGPMTPRKVPAPPTGTPVASSEAPAVSTCEAVSTAPTIVDIIGKAMASSAPPGLASNKSMAIKVAVTTPKAGNCKIFDTSVKSSSSRRSKGTSLTSSPETSTSAGPLASPSNRLLKGAVTTPKATAPLESQSNRLIKGAVTTPKATAPLESPYNRRSRLPLLTQTAAKTAVSSSLRETPGKMALNTGLTRNTALAKPSAVRRPWVEGAGNRAGLKRTATNSASENVL